MQAKVLHEVAAHPLGKKLFPSVTVFGQMQDTRPIPSEPAQ